MPFEIVKLNAGGNITEIIPSKNKKAINIATFHQMFIGRNIAKAVPVIHEA